MTAMRVVFLALSVYCQSAVAAESWATLDWARRAQLGTLVPGLIADIMVSPGQQVKRGQVLLRLDPRGFRATIAQAEAMLEQTRQRLAEAERELERTRELYDRTLLSNHELQLVEIDAVTAKAELLGAQAALEQARLDLEYSQIKAPFDGLVAAVKAEIGEAVASGLSIRPLVILVDNSRMRATLKLTDSEMLGLQPGDVVKIRIADDWLDGRIRYLPAEPVAQAQATHNHSEYHLHVEFEPPAIVRLRAGQRVEVKWDE